jgi:IS30 family transposase
MATDVKVHFCDPQSPGSAARTKTRMGYYDNTSLGEPTSAYTQADLDQVALRLNQRPRKTLGFQADLRQPLAALQKTYQH